MPTSSHHTFHIPVMGVAFTVDTPLRVAHFGITSALSIMDDDLLERMRRMICRPEGIGFTPIGPSEPDARARRITAYLDLLEAIVRGRTEDVRKQPFTGNSDIDRYFAMLPDSAPAKKLYSAHNRLGGDEKRRAGKMLREMVRPGAIEVNIMTKVDKTNYDENGAPMAAEFSDALSALRGFALSGLDSPLVFSAGLNPRLYSYLEQFGDFYPSAGRAPRKKIVIKVSDFRSAHVQGKFLAKKGLWVSEFRIESGLNCGGHAFATEGLLSGPILETFAAKRRDLYEELSAMYNIALVSKGYQLTEPPGQRITYQGGLGTAAEIDMLTGYYGLDGVGWGSPFLLVPEVTNLDDRTRRDLSTASPEDYYLSHASPLGVPFNNFRKSSSEAQRKNRVSRNRPGSPCYKKYLTFNTEFTERPICTASREYQHRKLAEVAGQELDEASRKQAVAEVTEKDCLCEGLAAAALLVNGETSHKLNAVTICPGPNLAYFSGIFTLEEMTDHIYGRANLLNNLPRAHVFINELKLNISYLSGEIAKTDNPPNGKHLRSCTHLLEGIHYYRGLLPSIAVSATEQQEMLVQLSECENSLERVVPGLKKPRIDLSA